MEGKAHIEIEQMLYGDFRVQVWNDYLNSMLDREYFCRGYASANSTAVKLQKDMFPQYAIYYRKGLEQPKLMKASLT